MTMIFNIMTLDLSKLKTIDFIYFYFISHFILFLLDLELSVFFLDQQFITRHTVVDCGSYFVTTYKRSRLHEEKKVEERERDREETEN